MSAPISHSQFQLTGADTPMQAGAMWRGALLDRFARLEAIALRCLVLLNADADAKPSSYVTWQRFNQLRNALENPRFAPVSKKRIALLDAIEGERELRTALAHGIVEAKRTGVALVWHAWKGGRWAEAEIRYGWLSALDALTRIDKLQRDFASQVGQVRKLLETTVP